MTRPFPSNSSTFLQPPPRLGNQYRDDRVLRQHLARALPEEVLRAVEPELEEMGELAGGELYRLQLADRMHEPRLVRYDAWGRRVDRIEVTEVWRRAERLAAERGVVAAAYDGEHASFARLHQFALAYLFTPSTDIYSCPLAMTDGAARTLLASGNRELVERAVPHLTSRDPASFWTSGQWMTETTGGSDVGRSETVARRDPSLGEDGWRLYGRKWFTSAAASQMALTLARPEGNPEGGRGLALFYVECRDEDGLPRGMRIERLKDKLGTRKLPTAEIELDGAPARLVAGTGHGIRDIVPMLAVTRTWNGVSALAYMRRGLALARDYAARRVAFGAPLAEKPLHVDTLAGLQAELEGAFHLVFRVVGLLGRVEAGESDEAEDALLRLLTPIMKLTSARQAVAVTSEVVEAFGGAGYVEDTGIPVLLRDAQVLSIWEGTTNVLALDALRALGGAEEAAHTWRLVVAEARRALGGVGDDGEIHLGSGLDSDLDTALDATLAGPARAALAGLESAGHWLRQASALGVDHLEAGARRFALTVGRCLELALLVEQARWSARRGDHLPSAAARRLAANGVDQLLTVHPDRLEDSRALANDLPLHVPEPEPAGLGPG